MTSTHPKSLESKSLEENIMKKFNEIEYIMKSLEQHNSSLPNPRTPLRCYLPKSWKIIRGEIL